jgi:PadR family transcriptional regulator, regulatory protein AphA
MPGVPSATGRVILGMIAKGLRSGYEIKQLVDRSTRHFWAASYGQIYPELRRLQDDGLIIGRPDPAGGRAKMAYDLTPEGERTLSEWLRSDAPLTYELRDEGMLKLFFSDVEPGTSLRTVRAMRELHERKRAQLREIEVKATHLSPGTRLTLELGLGVTTWLIDWCTATEERLVRESNVEVEV